MTRSEVRVLVHDFGRGLTDDDQAHNDRLLSALVLQKLLFTHPSTKLIASVAACLT